MLEGEGKGDAEGVDQEEELASMLFLYQMDVSVKWVGKLWNLLAEKIPALGE